MKRRKVLIYGGAGSVSYLLSRVPKLYADGITEDVELLEKFSQFYKKIEKIMGNEPEYKISNVDLDGGKKTVVVMLGKGIMKNKYDKFDEGTKLTLTFGLEGPSKLWGLVKDGKFKYASIYWGNENKMKKYLDVLLQHLEKED